MKRIYPLKNAKTIMVFSLMVLILTSCGETETLTVGVNSGYRPFGYVEEGKVKGFEIELWHEIAKEAGIRYKLKPLATGDLIKSVKDRKIDAAIAGITVKDSRKKIADFSTPYLYTGQTLLVRSDEQNINGVKDLKDKVVAAKIGTTGYEYLTKVKGIKEIQAFPTIDEAFQALLQRKVDAVIYDAPGIHHYTKNEGKGKTKAVGGELTKEHYSIAFPKGSRYTGKINNALRAIGENGTFERIYMKWFGEPPQSTPQS